MTPRIPEVAIAPVSLAITLGVGSFSTFLPKTTEIIDSVEDSSFANKVRLGEAGAAALALIMGAVLSIMVGDWSPFIGGVIIVIVLVGFYEYALRYEGT